MICFWLSEARQASKSLSCRHFLTLLQAAHRMTYMGERLHYANHIQEAVKYPSVALSIISDGMQQGHCKLPWYGTNASAPLTITQQLQGVLVHGREIVFYRHFHPTMKGTNTAINCFLLSLEAVYQREGCLPSTIYHQIDGGSENTSHAMMGICELLVSKRLCLKLILTGLLVGHTHAG